MKEKGNWQEVARGRQDPKTFQESEPEEGRRQTKPPKERKPAVPFVCIPGERPESSPSEGTPVGTPQSSAGISRTPASADGRGQGDPLSSVSSPIKPPGCG